MAHRTSLAKQAAAFRVEHAIPDKPSLRRDPPPSILFTIDEAKRHDSSEFAALAQKGLETLSASEPDVAALSHLFIGGPRDREALTREDNNRLSGEIRHLLLLISPFLQSRAAQEVLEGLLHRYHVHRWNVEDVLASALPYHDSPMFTRLLQGLNVKASPKWSWLQTLKEKPAALVRAAFAKYCSKDLSVLTFIGDVAMETAKLQKPNRPLATLFAAIWVDTLAAAKTVRAEMVSAALPAVMLLLRRPHLQDFFNAALVVAVALSLRSELHPSVRAQVLERVAKQTAGGQSRPAAAALAMLLQLQGGEAATAPLPEKVLRTLGAAGPEVLLGAHADGLDCQNLLTVMLAASFSTATGEGREAAELLADGLLSDARALEDYAESFALAALQAIFDAGAPGREGGAEPARRALATLAAKQPAALGRAFRKLSEAAARSGRSLEALAEVAGPICSLVPTDGAAEGRATAVPMLQAMAHRSSSVRAAAVAEAVEHLATASGEGGNLLVGLVLQATEDASAQVVGNALKGDDFWAKHPHAPPSATVPILESVLSRCMLAPNLACAGLPELACSIFFKEPKAARLSPLALRCLAKVCKRADCSAELKRRVDAFALPAVLLCAVGLDAKAEGLQPALEAASAPGAADELRNALATLCEASGHALLGALKGAKSLGLEAVAKAVTPETVAELCGLFDTARAAPLCGVASRAAAASVLAAALPRLLAADTADLLLQAAQACRHFASQLTRAGADAPVPWDACRSMLRAVLQGLGAGDEGSDKKRRRRSKGGGGGVGAPPTVPAAMAAVALVLDRPRFFAGEMRMALAVTGTVLRPAVLSTALACRAGEGAASAAARANALALVRGVVARGDDASEWALGQGALVPLLVAASRGPTKEVRSAALDLAAALGAGAPQSGEACWASPGAELLRSVGALRAPEAAMSAAAWAAAREGGGAAAEGLSSEVFGAVLAQLAAHRAEIVQDGDSVAQALFKLLSGKAGGAPDAKARGGACLFLSVGLALTASAEGEGAPLLPLLPLLGAIPVGPLMSCAQDIVKRAVDDIVVGLLGALPPEAPAYVRIVAERFATAGIAEETPAQAVAAADSFLRSVALPLLGGTASAFDQGLRSVSASMSALVGRVCDAVVRCPMGEARSEAMAALFRLGVASAAAASRVAEGEAPVGAATLPPQAVARAASEALARSPSDPALLVRLVTESATMKGRQGAGGRAAAELLGSQIAAVTGSTAELSPLLLSVTKAAVGAAGAWAKALAGGKATASEEPQALLQMLAAAASVSDRIAAAAASEGPAVGFGNHDAERLAGDVADACAALREVCAKLGGQTTSGVLAAVVRSCGSLAQVSAAAGVPAKDKLATPEAMPLPLRVCLEGMQACQGPLTTDAMVAIKGNLRAMWTAPKPDSSAMGFTGIRWDAVAQGRIRLLLHALLSGQLVGADVLDAPLYASVAQSAGVHGSLDFALLLYIARKVQDGAGPSKKKRSQRKRKSDLGELEALVAPTAAEAAADAAADEALGALMATGADSRYHVFGLFVQTLCALAMGLRGLGTSEKQKTCWGLQLVPQAFVVGLGAERAAAVLDIGLQVAVRFLSVHGLPDDLDDFPFDVALEQDTLLAEADRSSFGAAPDAAAAGASCASALCRAAWAACAVEVLLQDEAISSLGAAKACRASAQQARALLMRSMAVNHPVTFLRAACLALQVPDLHPAAAPGDLFAAGAAAGSVAMGAMAAIGEALDDRRGLRMETDGGEEPPFPEEAAPLCAAVLRHVAKRFLAANAEDTAEAPRLVAWSCAEALSRFCGPSAPKPVLKFCLPAAASCLAGFAEKTATHTSKVAVACCQYLRVAVEQLGKGILEKLAIVMPPLLDLAAAGEPAAGDELLSEGVMEALRALVHSVGPFLSPFLERLLSLSVQASLKLQLTLAEGLAHDLTAHVPHRLLLPAVQAAATAAHQELAVSGLDEIKLGLVRLQRLASLQAWIFAKAAPEFVAGIEDASVRSVLTLAAGGCKAAVGLLASGGQPEEVPQHILGRQLGKAKGHGKPIDELGWEASCATGGALQLNDLAAAAFSYFALRLDVDGVKSHVAKLLEWARFSQATALAEQAARKNASEEDFRGDAEAACRAIAAFAMLRRLAACAPGIAEELLLPLAGKDAASALAAVRRCALRLAALHRPAGKKRRRSGEAPPAAGSAREAMELLKDRTWWWLDVAMSTLGFLADALRAPAEAEPSAIKVLGQAADTVSEHCVDLVDVFEFLPPAEDSPVSEAMQEAVFQGLVAVASASDGPKVKQLLSAILSKSRSDDVEVRLVAIRACHRVWSDLGVQVVSGLSEVVMFASELLEDEEQRVEESVRRLIKTIEECTGESLQDALKH